MFKNKYFIISTCALGLVLSTLSNPTFAMESDASKTHSAKRSLSQREIIPEIGRASYSPTTDEDNESLYNIYYTLYGSDTEEKNTEAYRSLKEFATHLEDGLNCFANYIFSIHNYSPDPVTIDRVEYGFKSVLFKPEIKCGPSMNDRREYDSRTRDVLMDDTRTLTAGAITNVTIPGKSTFKFVDSRQTIGNSKVKMFKSFRINGNDYPISLPGDPVHTRFYFGEQCKHVDLTETPESKGHVKYGDATRLGRKATIYFTH